MNDHAEARVNNSPAHAIELTVALLRQIVARTPEVRRHTDVAAFILNELNPALVAARNLEHVKGTPGEHSRAKLATLAYMRFKTATGEEHQPEQHAFEEIIVTLLELQDEAWTRGILLDS